MEEPKNDSENIENVHSIDERASNAHVLRSKADELSVWQTARQFKVISMVAMIASFSASLDGYQINLNGGIVANTGFIRQFASKGRTTMNSTYVSAWGGIQSAGQTVGQILLQYVTEAYGRKVALYIIWVDLVISIFIESFATRWEHWLVAKLFSGMGVGMLQSTLPLYLSEIAPTQLRGFYINAYSFWFVLGQIFASVALNRLNDTDPMDFRTPIYTQWAMIGCTAIIFILIPESPWWLVSKGKLDEAANVLRKFNGKVEGYDVQEQISVMDGTVTEERLLAERNAEIGKLAVFKGRNLIRFIIASWPKITQQFVGLAVFNTYATYFFQYAGNKNPFLVTVILSCVQLLSMILTATLTDQFGRRPLTVYPYAVTVFSLLIFFACLATFSTTGASAIGYAYPAEVPQQRLRAQTSGWALALSNGVAILFSFCTPLMIDNGSVSHWGVKTGFFFAGSGTIAVIVAWFILPEVTRRTPAEIDELFEKKVNLRKFKGYVTEVQLRADESHNAGKIIVDDA
ncbi:hypothetical protein N7478_012842 [Penicillium angulare]|uniref:uncharacterized protein n=1 Tax=Penicillium angulare TaxID=116970 RepID=UPI002540906F|nr:uncharacterized protein N7478_012842 [Penicillium angulare]KAJ5256738.1 hypothetical protein N7478_012842 [Penicillium angulare]